MIASSRGTVAPVARLVALGVTLVATRQAIAEETTISQRAQALFDEARERMREQKYSLACPLFAESQALDPGGGTILNLAICHEQEGRFATALLEMREALAQAKSAQRADRVGTAVKHLAVLENKASFLVILPPRPEHAVTFALTLDGTMLDPVAAQHPVPLDPGQHILYARTATGADRTWAISVGEHAEHYQIDLATIREARHRQTTTSTPTPARPEASPRAFSPSVPTLSRRTNQPLSGGNAKRVGFALIGSGLAAAGVGAYWAYVSRSLIKQSDREFDGRYCTHRDCVASWAQAKRAARAADAFFLLGAVASGVGLYVTFAPSSRKQSTGSLLLSVDTAKNAALLSASAQF